MSTKRALPLRSKKMSSCVRPGVREVRASAPRPVSALTSEDLPTFDRPAKAISGGPPARRRRHRRQAVGARGGEDEFARAREQFAPGLCPVGRDRRFAHTLGVFAGLVFLGNSLKRLSQSSTFTPARLMTQYCCSP